MGVKCDLKSKRVHIEVNRLVKGRPLDSLEFLQWLKRYCESVNGGIMNENYNALERRSKVGKERNVKGSQRYAKSLQTNNCHNPGLGEGITKITRIKQGRSSPVMAGVNSSAEIQALSKEVTDLKLSVDHLEKERDFYFAKLRDIEILCQTPELDNVPLQASLAVATYLVLHLEFNILGTPMVILLFRNCLQVLECLLEQPHQHQYLLPLEV